MTAAASFIRKATPDDVDYGIELFKEQYPNRDIEQMRNWLYWVAKNPNFLVLIGVRSIGCASVYYKYGTETRMTMHFLAAAAKPGAVLEPLSIVRMLIDWAKEKGATGDLVLDSDTGVDFAPFAKRLGGELKTIRQWEIPLSSTGE
jgi:hypothetical protein